MGVEMIRLMLTAATGAATATAARASEAAASLVKRGDPMTTPCSARPLLVVVRPEMYKASSAGRIKESARSMNGAIGAEMDAVINRVVQCPVPSSDLAEPPGDVCGRSRASVPCGSGVGTVFGKTAKLASMVARRAIAGDVKPLFGSRGLDAPRRPASLAGMLPASVPQSTVILLVVLRCRQTLG